MSRPSRRSLLSLAILALLLLPGPSLLGCGSHNEETSSEEPPQGEQSEQAQSEEGEQAEAEEGAEGAEGEQAEEGEQDQNEAPALSGEPVDLLGAVETAVAVSTVYRDRTADIAKLFDGDLETAWNSQSGNLVGAWIEVRLPEAAQVSSIRMTAGFTKQGSTDLFTANHRITRVRVTRDGEEVGSYPLDPNNRGLQEVPVSGPGGVYRIELAETQVGSRSDWTEACISELQVMGRAPEATPGRRFPRFAAGALPPQESAPAEVDAAALARSLRDRTQWLEREWTDYEMALRGFSREMDSGAETSADELVELRRQRARILERVAELVAQVDPVRAEPLRRGIATGLLSSGSWSANRADLDRISEGMAAVIERVGQDEARCRWARMEIRLRITRMRDMIYVEDAGDPPPAWETLDRADSEWSRNSQGVSQRLGRMSAAPDPSLGPEWAPMQRQITIARSACGWEAGGSE